MPWDLKKSGAGYYVTNLETGKRMSRHPLTKKRAQAQLRALYSSVPEARKEETYDSFRENFNIAIKQKAFNAVTLKKAQAKRGNINGLAKHLAKQHGGDPHFFTKCMADESLSSYPEDIRKAICARAHRIAIGHWPAEDAKKETAPTVRNILEGKIHQSFTVAADQLFQRGYIDRDTRIALSGLIGDVLTEFGDRFEETGLNIELKPSDAEDIANKEDGSVSSSPTGIPAHGTGGLFSTPGLGTSTPVKKKKKLADFRHKEFDPETLKGGPGSGNFGHAGVRGHRGGSAPKSGIGAAWSVRTGRNAVAEQRYAKGKIISQSFEKMGVAELKNFADSLEQANKWDPEVSAKTSRNAWYIQGSALRAKKAPNITLEKESILERIEEAASNQALRNDQVTLAEGNQIKVDGMNFGKKSNEALYNSAGTEENVYRKINRTDTDPSFGFDYISKTHDYQVYNAIRVPSGGYQVELTGGTVGVGHTKRDATRKARMNLFQHDVLSAIRSGRKIPGETLFEAGLTVAGLRQVRSAHPGEPEPWDAAISALKRTLRERKKELTDLYDEQRREYSRIKEDGAIERLRSLRQQSRRLVQRYASVAQVMKEYDENIGWVDGFKESHHD